MRGATRRVAPFASLDEIAAGSDSVKEEGKRKKEKGKAPQVFGLYLFPFSFFLDRTAGFIQLSISPNRGNQGLVGD